MLLAILAGLRRNEIYTLAWHNIDLDNSRIHLSAENTKGNYGRLVHMPEFLREHLFKLRKENPFAEKIFHDWKTVNKMIFEWRRLRRTLSFKKLSNGLQLHLHDLRHVYAQSLRDAGVPLGDIQTFLGHHSVRVTESRYAMFGGKDAREKVERISNIIPLKKAEGQ